MQSQPFMKPLTSFIKVLNFNCYLGNFRRSLLRNEMMININSNIFDVPTTGKTSVTTNKQWFWKQTCDNTGDSRLFISLCFRYRPIFIFFFFFLCSTNFVSVGPGFFCAVGDQFLLLKKLYFLFFFNFLCSTNFVSGQGSFLPFAARKDSRATICLLSVGRHLGISIVLKWRLAYIDWRL